MRHVRDDDSSWLFEHPAGFAGLPAEGFRLFSMPDRDRRRRSILETIHPALERLGEDLLRRLTARATQPLHAHLPRLDWPRGYQPFCTWLALSREAHGYQSRAQLNIGVHADHVAVRLGWDTAAAGFGRFEFLCRLGHLDAALVELARREDLRFRVYAAAPWPQGSLLVFESDDDLGGSFAEVRRRGVWWELGRRFDLPEALPLVGSAEFGDVAARVFAALLPLYQRIEGDAS